jgi:RNA polymerase-binding transcription factor DksA
MVKVKASKDKERDKAKDDKAKDRDRERDSHKDKEHKDKDHKDKANGKPAKELFKSPFSSDDLAKWRQLLLSRRAEISNDIDGLVKDAMEAEDGHTTPNHIAERGSDADLQDMSLGVAGEEKEVLWQIDRALRKIQLSHPLPYGLCEYTKTAIPRTRLQLIPWTPLSIEGATHMEQNNLTIEDVLHDE